MWTWANKTESRVDRGKVIAVSTILDITQAVLGGRRQWVLMSYRQCVLNSVSVASDVHRIAW